jgi:hypothetical protein
MKPLPPINIAAVTVLKALLPVGNEDWITRIMKKHRNEDG